MKEKPIKKAWECITPQYDWDDVDVFYKVYPSIVYAETRSKAKYEFHCKMEFEWNHRAGWIFCKARRAKDHDLYAPKPKDILSQISEEQKKIIAHANGNSGREPGYRDYYYCSSVDKNLLHLVKLGLMVGPQHVNSSMLIPGNGYFYLTDEGKSAAFSMLPRKGVA